MKNFPAVDGVIARATTPSPTAAPSADPARRAEVPCIRSAELFGLSNEIEIEHGESRYRLRKTLLGKLIMTK